MKRKPRDIPVIHVPVGFCLEDLMDTDDSGYDFEDAILCEEVSVHIESDNGE